MKHYKQKSFQEHWDFMIGYTNALKETKYFEHLWCLGNMLKYTFRAPFKGCFEEDINKVIVYANKILLHNKK